METLLLVFYKKEMDKMMKCMRELYSTEQAPIGFAVEKILSATRAGNLQRRQQRYLISCLSQYLQIVKVRNRYICNKRRVDTMDFKL